MKKVLDILTGVLSCLGTLFVIAAMFAIICGLVFLSVFLMVSAWGLLCG